MGYLEDRFKPFGFAESFFTPTINKKPCVLFSSDEKDNIQIHYHLLNGAPWTYKEKIGERSKRYIRTRLKTPYLAVKYLSPKGAGLLPFFPPKVIEAYLSKSKIKSLYLIEGEIKAAVCDYYGLFCVGLGSIHGFYAPADQNRPHYKELAPEIQDLIEVCQIEKIVYLTDADTLALEYDPDKDVYKRATSFYSAVNNFRNATKRLVYNEESSLKAFYFAHIKDIHLNKAKGIDDLLLFQMDRTQEIIDAMLAVQINTQWFDFCDLLDHQQSDLKKYFGCTNEKEFYEVYGDYLGSREFVFRSVKYYYDGKELVKIKDARLDDYLRIGVNYYKKTMKTRLVEGMTVKMGVLTPWAKGEISTDFGPKALNYIKKFDDFVNFPNWLDFTQVVENNFNICRPLPYTPKIGKIDTFVKFIQHIAGSEDFISVHNGAVKENPVIASNGTMLLDYLSLMIQQPTMPLPVLCLISKNQETGKTTLAQMIALMFEGNSVIMQTKDFTNDFNSLWASKFFLCVDEGRFDDKKAAKEQLKYLSISSEVGLNTKNKAQMMIDNFSKIMICSNDENGFILLEPDDLRFWLLKVQKVEKRDPNLKAELFREIPAIFYYLANRDIFHLKITRQWFADECVQNELFWHTLKVGKAHWKIEIDYCINHIFENIQKDVIKMTVNDILLAVTVFRGKSDLTPVSVRRYLKDDLLLEPQEICKYDTYIIQAKGFAVEPVFSYTGKPYILKRENFK